MPPVYIFISRGGSRETVDSEGAGAADFSLQLPRPPPKPPTCPFSSLRTLSLQLLFSDPRPTLSSVMGDSIGDPDHPQPVPFRDSLAQDRYPYLHATFAASDAGTPLLPGSDSVEGVFMHRFISEVCAIDHLWQNRGATIDLCSCSF